MGAGDRVADGNLAGVEIVATDGAKEDLAFHTEAAAGDGPAAGFDQAGDHLELWPEAGTEGGSTGRHGDGSREGDRPVSCGRGWGNGVIKEGAGVDGMGGDAAVSLGLQIAVGQAEQ